MKNCKVQSDNKYEQLKTGS
jgi:hypothetical protein